MGSCRKVWNFGVLDFWNFGFGDSGIFCLSSLAVRYECCIRKRAEIRPAKKQVSHQFLQCFEGVCVSWGSVHTYIYICMYIYICIQIENILIHIGCLHLAPSPTPRLLTFCSQPLAWVLVPLLFLVLVLAYLRPYSGLTVTS